MRMNTILVLISVLLTFNAWAGESKPSYPLKIARLGNPNLTQPCAQVKDPTSPLIHEIIGHMFSTIKANDPMSVAGLITPIFIHGLRLSVLGIGPMITTPPA